MRAGIIAEGKSDLAIITNILKGALGIDRSDIQFLLPELDYDETDLSQMPKEMFSIWTIVKKRCVEGDIVTRFFNGIDDQRFLVIHIDTAERSEIGYDVGELKKVDEPGYVLQIRGSVILKLKEWLGENFHETIAFAVAVEETEAWLIPVFDPNVLETGFYPSPKEKLGWLLNRPNALDSKNRKRLFQIKDAFDRHLELSQSLRKNKNLEKYAAQNQSLKLFYSDLQQFAV